MCEIVNAKNLKLELATFSHWAKQQCRVYIEISTMNIYKCIEICTVPVYRVGHKHGRNEISASIWLLVKRFKIPYFVI